MLSWWLMSHQPYYIINGKTLQIGWCIFIGIKVGFMINVCSYFSYIFRGLEFRKALKHLLNLQNFSFAVLLILDMLTLFSVPVAIFRIFQEYEILQIIEILLITTRLYKIFIYFCTYVFWKLRCSKFCDIEHLEAPDITTSICLKQFVRGSAVNQAILQHSACCTSEWKRILKMQCIFYCYVS